MPVHFPHPDPARRHRFPPERSARQFLQVLPQHFLLHPAREVPREEAAPPAAEEAGVVVARDKRHISSLPVPKTHVVRLCPGEFWSRVFSLTGKPLVVRFVPGRGFEPPISCEN